MDRLSPHPPNHPMKHTQPMNLGQAIRQGWIQRDIEAVFQSLVRDNDHRRAYGLPEFEPSYELARKIVANAYTESTTTP